LDKLDKKEVKNNGWSIARLYKRESNWLG
jgi:hypothetical protein